jgi:hypothetical protein
MLQMQLPVCDKVGAVDGGLFHTGIGIHHPDFE